MHMYIYACSLTDCTVAVFTSPPTRCLCTACFRVDPSCSYGYSSHASASLGACRNASGARRCRGKVLWLLHALVRRWPHTTWIRLDKAMRICKDTEDLDSPRSQMARTRNAPTCTEPNVPPNIEHTERSPFSTPSAFTPAYPGKPQAQLLAQGAAAGCFRRPRRIASWPGTSEDRTLHDVRKYHPRAGRDCPACFSLPRVVGCH